MKLSEFHQDVDYQQLVEQLQELKQRHQFLANHFNFLKEDHNMSDELYSLLVDIQKRLDGARRGLGLANKLASYDKDASRKHRIRILANMNVIRGKLRQVERAIEQQVSDEGRRFSSSQGDLDY